MKRDTKAIRTLVALFVAALFGLSSAATAAQDDGKNDKPAATKPKKKAPKKAKQDAAPPAEEAVADADEATADAPAKEAPVDQGRKTALVSTMVLKVINPNETRAALEEEVAKLGGFPVLITDGSLTIKVPPEKLSEILQLISDKGLVLEKSIERQDLTEAIAQLEGRLKSKRAILARLRGFFDDSNVQATLRIEQTMTDLVTEIEQVKGELRVLGERSRWAVVDVAFQFKQRDRIVYVHSPFEWLNTVNLDRFLEDF